MSRNLDPDILTNDYFTMMTLCVPLFLLMIVIWTTLLPCSDAFRSTTPYTSDSFETFTLKSTATSNVGYQPKLVAKRPLLSPLRRQNILCSCSPMFAAGVEDLDKTKTGNNKMKILGICGGIGSGKSTACQLMVDKLGCVARIDADKLAHCVYESGSQSFQDIVAEFGKDILRSSDDSDNDNAVLEIDRQKLGSIVFRDPKAMSKLERIVWPHVRTKIEEKITEITNKYRSESSVNENEIIIVEAALLLETDWHDMLHGLWVIHASPSVAVQRLMDDRGFTENEAWVRIRAQQKRRGLSKEGENGECLSDELRNEMKKGIVTAVVRNDGTLSELQKDLEKTLYDTSAFKR